MHHTYLRLQSARYQNITIIRRRVFYIKRTGTMINVYVIRIDTIGHANYYYTRVAELYSRHRGCRLARGRVAWRVGIK